MSSTGALLDVRGLTTKFLTQRGEVTAVDRVDFSVSKGEIVGLVGESGCGKSVTASSVMRLLDDRFTSYEGQVVLDGTDLLALAEKDMQGQRGRTVAMVFQDPMTSLNPVLSIGDQMIEAIRAHRRVSVADSRAIALEMLERTSLPDPVSRMKAYPHELSGGMRQRVVIAMALSCNPKLLIADEPTTALDVTTQAQILDLVTDMRDELNTGTLLITHDLGVVAQVCDRVLVMYLGQIIENANVGPLFELPLHPYTLGLLKATPSIEGDRETELAVIPGRVPSLHEVPKGCRFADRCPFVTQKCRDQVPPLEEVTPERSVRCWNYRDVAAVSAP